MDSVSENSQNQPFSWVKLNALRVLIMLLIAMGYASTMPMGPGSPEILAHLGYDPSWLGVQLLFFISGLMAMASVTRHGSAQKYLTSRMVRNAPLLIVVTLITVLLIYPVFGVHSGSFSETAKKLGMYFFGTISCFKAGEPLPGLLDDAKYMCLIQGAIWTLKWGLMAHIAVATAQYLNLFKYRALILFGALLSIASYFSIQSLNTHTETAVNHSLILGNRLAWPFLSGMAIYAYRDKLSNSTALNLLGAALFFTLAVTWYYNFFWSHAIEILLTMGWMGMALTALLMKPTRLRVLNNWPALALAIYIITWPISQLLLLSFPEVTAWQLVAMTLPVTVILSWGFHQLVTSKSYRKAAKLAGNTVLLERFKTA